jgi:hypothetical protein
MMERWTLNGCTFGERDAPPSWQSTGCPLVIDPRQLERLTMQMNRVSLRAILENQPGYGRLYTKSKKSIPRETAVMERGCPIVVTLNPKHLRLHLKSTKESYDLYYARHFHSRRSRAEDNKGGPLDQSYCW